jgi:hypothetical protein
VNERRKPDRSGKAARSVAGAACECRWSTCRWKALRAGKAALVDARAVEAVLALRSRSARPGGREERQGASEVWSSASTAAENAAPKRPPWNGAGVLLHETTRRRRVTEQAEACETASTVSRPGVGLPKGGPALRSRRCSGFPNQIPGGAAWRWSSRRKLRARELSDRRVRVS